MATTSAWALGSLAEVTWFHPSAMISPLYTITAPNGPPLLSCIFSSANATARCMNRTLLMTALIRLPAVSREETGVEECGTRSYLGNLLRGRGDHERPFGKARLGLVDQGQRRQALLIAEMLDRIGRRRPGEAEMIDPGRLRRRQVGIHVGAVKDVTRSVGVEDAVRRHVQRRQHTLGAALVVPKQTKLAKRDAADFAAARAQVVQHLARREVHLLAQSLGHHGD